MKDLKHLKRSEPVWALYLAAVLLTGFLVAEFPSALDKELGLERTTKMTMLDLMANGAKALQELDTEALEKCIAHVNGLMITDDERENAITVLEAMLEAAYELEAMHD